MIQPHLIVIAGPPAAGKTTLARQIARALRLPVICKDTLKESLFDHLGAGDRAQSQRLGYADTTDLDAVPIAGILRQLAN
jgi:predicted kinase